MLRAVLIKLVGLRSCLECDVEGKSPVTLIWLGISSSISVHDSAFATKFFESPHATNAIRRKRLAFNDNVGMTFGASVGEILP